MQSIPLKLQFMCNFWCRSTNSKTCRGFRGSTRSFHTTLSASVRRESNTPVVTRRAKSEIPLKSLFNPRSVRVDPRNPRPDLGSQKIWAGSETMRSQPNTPINEGAALRSGLTVPKSRSRWRRARNQNLRDSGNAVNSAKVVVVGTTLVVEKGRFFLASQSSRGYLLYRFRFGVSLRAKS